MKPEVQLTLRYVVSTIEIHTTKNVTLALIIPIYNLTKTNLITFTISTKSYGQLDTCNMITQLLGF